MAIGVLAWAISAMRARTSMVSEAISSGRLFMATIRRWVLSVSTTGTAAAFITVSLMNARMIPSMASCSSVKSLESL